MDVDILCNDDCRLCARFINSPTSRHVGICNLINSSITINDIKNFRCKIFIFNYEDFAKRFKLK